MTLKMVSGLWLKEIVCNSLIYLLHYCRSIAWLTWGNTRFRWIAPNYALEFCCKLITFLAITVPQEVDLQMEIQSRLHLFFLILVLFIYLHCCSWNLSPPLQTALCVSVRKHCTGGVFLSDSFLGKGKSDTGVVCEWAQEITVSTRSNFGMMNSKQNLTISYFLVVFTLSCLVLVCDEECFFKQGKLIFWPVRGIK